MRLNHATAALAVIGSFGLLTGCGAKGGPVGKKLERKGDEIVVAGQFFHTGAPVVLWMDPGGFDAYRTERRFAEYDNASYKATTRQAVEIQKSTGRRANFADIDSPERVDLRAKVLTDEEIARFRGGGWDLKSLQDKVDQFVYHFDVCSTASQCFFILHDIRGLSVHFMLDIDGTIYQTCDVKERAWHATIANPRSVGIEIANIGCYRPGGDTLKQWYRKDEKGRTRVVLPAFVQKSKIRKPGPYYPARNEPVVGQIRGREYEQYDLTDAQYDSLTKLTAALCTALPKITCDYPREENGKVLPETLPREKWDDYQGLLGHWHVQDNKTDPGPAFNWDRVQKGAWKLMSGSARKANRDAKGKPVRFVQPNAPASKRANPTTAPSTATAP
jgi:N-acetyl-anhydromuramyl-L-alanine amidase AmpD